MSGHLVLVTSSFPIRGDGSEAAGSFVADLAEEFAREVDVRIVAPGAATQREPWTGRIEIFRYAAPSRPLSTLRPWRPDDLRWITRVWHGGQGMTRAAVAQDGTAVLALWGLPCGEWARRVAQQRGIGYSVWLLGSDVWSLGRLPIGRRMLSRVIRKAEHAYADGYKLADEARRIAGTPVAFLPSARRIHFVDPPAPRSAPPYRLLFLGRWHPNKGVDLFLEALAMLRDEDWQRIESVEIQGGGPLEPLVSGRIDALRAAHRPLQMGRFLDKPEAEAAIARADWILIPSRIESIPVVFSDAMKIGRPVIATPVGDLDRLISGADAGIVASDVTAGALADALKQALMSDARGMAGGSETLAQQFDPAKIAARLLDDFATKKNRTGT